MRQADYADHSSVKERRKMKLTTKISLAGVSALLIACGPPPEPVVSSFNESSVSIQLNGESLAFASESVRQEAYAKADARAADICSRGPNRNAEYVSTRSFSTGQYSSVVERLYLCLRG